MIGRLDIGRQYIGRCDVGRETADLGWWYEDVLTEHVKVRITLSSPGGKAVDVVAWWSRGLPLCYSVLLLYLMTNLEVMCLFRGVLLPLFQCHSEQFHYILLLMKIVAVHLAKLLTDSSSNETKLNGGRKCCKPILVSNDPMLAGGYHFYD